MVDHLHPVGRQMRQPVEPAGVGQRVEHDDVPVRRGDHFIGDVGAGETGSPVRRTVVMGFLVPRLNKVVHCAGKRTVWKAPFAL